MSKEQQALEKVREFIYGNKNHITLIELSQNMEIIYNALEDLQVYKKAFEISKELLNQLWVKDEVIDSILDKARKEVSNGKKN